MTEVKITTVKNYWSIIRSYNCNIRMDLHLQGMLYIVGFKTFYELGDHVTRTILFDN